MTYSIAAKCRRTGMYGAAVTTSSIAVGSRCPYAKAGVGAVLTQHRTDPRLGPRGLELLEDGKTADETIRTLSEGTPGIGYRQLAVVDREGGTAWFHGDKIASVHNASQSDGCIAIANIVRSEKMTDTMIDAFLSREQEHLGERLLAALEAGHEAGGEFKQEKSAALLVVHEQSFPLVDLRVDYDRSVLPQLRFLWENYLPLIDEYVTRAVAPDSLPGSG